MSFNPINQFLTVIFFLQVIITAVGAGNVTCECKAVSESFLVTRLWNINREEWTNQGVIDEFENGFAPLVTNLGGFQEYLSAKTIDESTVFFFNIFTSPETARAAQEGAKSFVANGALNGAITPNQFTESVMSFHFSSDPCITESIQGKYLSTELWLLTKDSNFTIQGVADEFEEGYAPIIMKADGFLEYGGAPVPGTRQIFFYNVFETQDGAAAANGGAALFVRLGRLKGNIQKVIFTEGIIGFDYTCAGEVPDPPDTTTVGDSSSGVLAFPISIAATFLPLLLVMIVPSLVVGAT